MGELLHGRVVANQVESEVTRRVAELAAAGHEVGLDVILVGDDPASAVYVRHKERGCARVGMRSRVHRLRGDTSEEDLIALIHGLNDDPDVDGILVQLPLPPAMVEARVLNAIAAAKDVDGFHVENAGHLVTDRRGLPPCTPKGIMRLLDHIGFELRGKHAVVLGRSRIVGRPMAAMLLAADATVTVCHRHTADSAAHARLADLLVVAVGKAGMVTGDWIKPGAVVIDVGINRLADGKLAGDVVTTQALHRASWVTPVPGGIGPMTIAMLLENTAEAASRITSEAEDPSDQQYALGAEGEAA